MWKRQCATRFVSCPGTKYVLLEKSPAALKGVHGFEVPLNVPGGCRSSWAALVSHVVLVSHKNSTVATKFYMGDTRDRKPQRKAAAQQSQEVQEGQAARAARTAAVGRVIKCQDKMLKLYGPPCVSVSCVCPIELN